MVDQLAELRNADPDRSLFAPELTIRALRDSRYRNTAYAIAELIDNAIEAGAEQIDLLCMEESRLVTERDRRQVSEIAVLDKGEGMDLTTLFHALKFGGGTRHDNTRGIGKYGMGLPTASMSQCKKVDVWTWQEGVDSVWHSSIDADDIENGNHQVPFPDQDTPIPNTWRTAGSHNIYKHRSGTLVVWSKLDKIQWKTAAAIIRNTSWEVGRIHRHFITADIHRIRTASFLGTRPNEFSHDEWIVANDPLYLMKRTSVREEPWDSEPMFTQWGETRHYPVSVDGREETIEVNYSIVKPEALKTDAATRFPGNTARGKHAGRNIGVSVVREDREIILEGAFLREGGSTDNPQNRWWGCEIQFRSSCDELFGVDHNKQQVANFTQAARNLASGDSLDDLLVDRDDPIHKIVAEIRRETYRMMEQIKLMFAKRNDIPRSRTQRTPTQKAVETATNADRIAIEAGTEMPTKTDIAREQLSPQERIAGLTEELIESGHTQQDAQELARRLVQEDLSYQFNSEQLDGYQMFRWRPSPMGVLHINLNTDHPIYDLIKHIEDDIGETNEENDPAFQSIVAIRLLLSSWARMEDQTESSEERRRLQDITYNWGRQVDKVISQLRDRDG